MITEVERGVQSSWEGLKTERVEEKGDGVRQKG